MSDFDNKFQSKLKTIAEEETEFLRYADILRAEYQKSELETMSADRKSYDKRLRTLLGDMQSPINRIEKQLQSYEDDLQEAERIEILNWLSPIPYLQHHSQIKTHVLAGTGQWLLDHDTLLDWQYSESSSILWLHGIPGSGKSTVV